MSSSIRNPQWHVIEQSSHATRFFPSLPRSSQHSDTYLLFTGRGVCPCEHPEGARQSRPAVVIVPDARPPGCERLSGQERYRLLRGIDRIVYEIHDDVLKVIVVKVGHRRDVYRSSRQMSLAAFFFPNPEARLPSSLTSCASVTSLTALLSPLQSSPQDPGLPPNPQAPRRGKTIRRFRWQRGCCRQYYLKRGTGSRFHE